MLHFESWRRFCVVAFFVWWCGFFSLNYFMEQLLFPLEFCGPNPKRLLEFHSMSNDFRRYFSSMWCLSWILFSNILTSQSHYQCPDKWSNNLKFRIKERNVSSFLKISCMGEIENVVTTTSCCYCNGLINRTNQMQEKDPDDCFFKSPLHL